MPIIFQYGSNCLESEINGPDRLNGDAKFFDIAETVGDFELSFNVHSRKSWLNALAYYLPWTTH